MECIRLAVIGAAAVAAFLLYLLLTRSSTGEGLFHAHPYSARLAIIQRMSPEVHDALPLQLSSDFASPCWRRNASTGLQCLPAFFLAGAMQSGVPDLWQRLHQHELVPAHHNAMSYWWTSHPRSSAGDFAAYVRRFSNKATLRAVEARPESLLGDASSATFTFMFAESLRLHYRYRDAFDRCYLRCKGRHPPKSVPACKSRLKASQGGYRGDHCYNVAERATAPLDFNIPSLAVTVLPDLKVVVLLREPAERLWIAFWKYRQFPDRYGSSATGFGYYFGNQSAAWHDCTRDFGTQACALRFEGNGPDQAGVFYHCDQLIKGMYSEFLGEWQVRPALTVMARFCSRETAGVLWQAIHRPTSADPPSTCHPTHPRTPTHFPDTFRVPRRASAPMPPTATNVPGAPLARITCSYLPFTARARLGFDRAAAHSAE